MVGERLKTLLQRVIATSYAEQFHARGIHARSRPRGFSGAIVARVETSTGQLCLRGWPKRGLPAARIRGLHRLLRHVHDSGVKQVAVPVGARSGETLIFAHGQMWQLEPWMPGTADFWSRPHEARLRSAMRCLSAWHLAARDFQPSRNERIWFSTSPAAASPAVAERRERIAGWLGGRLDRLSAAMANRAHPECDALAATIASDFRRAAPPGLEELDALTAQQFPLQPCLRDVWHDHLLFTGDEVTGLIDASACRTENVVTDLSRLLGSLLGDDRDRWQFALEEYTKHRPLDAGELRLLDALDRSEVLLSGMTWLDRIYLKDEPPVDIERVMARLRTIASRLAKLVRED